ncbi:hypothetical protein Mgra_00006088 [Meloidogyne graminicola]|jgi:hypothetical protein
MESI